LLNHKAAAEDYEMTSNGRHLLHLAAENCSGEVVALLLAHNPRLINARTKDGRTALHHTGSGQVAAQLITHDPTLIDVKDTKGDTAFI